MLKVSYLGNQAMSAGRGLYLAGLGVIATAEQEGKKVFSTLVEKGERKSHQEESVSVERVSKLDEMKNRVLDLSQVASDKVQNGVATLFGSLGIPSRQEIIDLTKSVETLTDKVQSLQAKTA